MHAGQRSTDSTPYDHVEHRKQQIASKQRSTGPALIRDARFGAELSPARICCTQHPTLLSSQNV